MELNKALKIYFMFYTNKNYNVIFVSLAYVIT